MDREESLLAADGNWGDFQIKKGFPDVENFQECIYLPWQHDRRWGLFASEDVPDVGRQDLAYNNESLIYCGDLNCHFGHFLIGTVSRLWSLQGKSSARLLFHSSNTVQGCMNYDHVESIFDSLGINPDSIVILNRPTRLVNVVAPGTSFKEQSFAYEVFGDLCCEIGRRIGYDHAVSPTDTPTYFSRSRLKVGTACFVNENLLEEELIARGAAIFYPETADLRTQISVMRNTKCAIGIAGSALHLNAFCGSKRTIGISAGKLVNSNFRIVDAVCDNRATYVYPHRLTQVPTPPGFHLAWRLDDPSSVAEGLMRLVHL